VSIGGYAWETAGHIWYDTIEKNESKLRPNATFIEFCNATIATAKRHYPKAVQALIDAWTQVGVLQGQGLVANANTGGYAVPVENYPTRYDSSNIAGSQGMGRMQYSAPSHQMKSFETYAYAHQHQQIDGYGGNKDAPAAQRSEGGVCASCCVIQ